MLNISKTIDNEVIKSIITTPKLFQLTYGQGINSEDYQVKEGWNYYLGKWDNEILVLFQTREFTKKVLEVHIYCLPKFWGTEVPEIVSKKFMEYIKDKTKFTSLMTDVPVDCKPVHKLIEKLHGKCIGLIKNGCIYNNRSQDLILYQYELTNEI